MVILLGVLFQLLQLGYSIWKRKELAVGSDPWGGRTLEWATPTPIAEYNFATLDTVKSRDEFWEMKQTGRKRSTHFEPIHLPKNTGYGVYISLAAFVVGFAVIWHIWWLALATLVAVVGLAIASTLRENTEYELSAHEVAATEERLWKAKA